MFFLPPSELNFFEGSFEERETRRKVIRKKVSFLSLCLFNPVEDRVSQKRRRRRRGRKKQKDVEHAASFNLAIEDRLFFLTTTWPERTVVAQGSIRTILRRLDAAA